MVKVLTWIRIIIISSVFAFVAFCVCAWFLLGLTFGNPRGWWVNGIGHFLSGVILLGTPAVVFLVACIKQAKNN